MRITYASNHTWYKFIAEDPLSQFGKSSAAKLRATHAQLSSSITVRESEVDDALLSWFIPLYESRIQSKHNPTVIDIRSQVFGASSQKYHALTLFDGETPLGATLFTVRKNKLSLAYRSYTAHWKEKEYPASPALFMELEICKHAQLSGKKAITHGKDRNPYGMYSEIGLASFKLSTGCKMRKSRNFTIKTLETDSLTEDVFVLEYPGDDHMRIAKGYLIATKKGAEQWQQLTKYPHLLQVEVIER